MRRVVGVLIAVAALVGAAASQPGVQEGARLEAQAAAERATTPVRLRAQEGLRAYLQRQESRAVAAAALPQLRAQLALLRNHRLEGELQATLADWFRGEAEWEPFRREFGIYAVSADDEGLGLVEGIQGRLGADRLVADARSQGVASSWLDAGGLLAAATARVAVPNRRIPAVLLLGKEMGGDALRVIAEQVGGGLILAEGRRDLARSASGPELVRLLEAVRSGQPDGYVADDGSWAAVAVPILERYRLWIAFDASPTALVAGASVRTTQAIIWAAGALIALLALFIGLRRQSSSFGAASARAAPIVPIVAEPEPNLPEADSGSGLSPLPSPSPVEEPFRQQPFGRYTLLDRLGEGGMAQVFTAVIFGAEGFRRRFVIKRVRPELLQDPAVKAHFIEDANLASSLVHSNIVPVLDFGKVGDEYFLATEYILGRDLGRLTTRRRETGGGGLPLPAALHVAHEVLKALEYAHGRSGPAGRPPGMVHRDLSPDNILVSGRGEIKLLDFGTVTLQGGVRGNAFMSPEQARGQQVDARADLFSVGLVLFYCLTGEGLYRGNTSYEVLLQAATGPSSEDLARLRTLPEPAGAIIERALQVDPKARYQSAAEFLSAVAPHVGRGAIAMGETMNRTFGEELRQEEARFIAATAAAAPPVASFETRSTLRPGS
jgi:hypothetical protein